MSFFLPEVAACLTKVATERVVQSVDDGAFLNKGLKQCQTGIEMVAFWRLQRRTADLPHAIFPCSSRMVSIRLHGRQSKKTDLHTSKWLMD